MEHLNENNTIAVQGSSPNSPSNARVHEGVPVREVEFMANEGRRLQQLADLIRSTGKTPLEIANACGLDKRTVLRALKARPLKSDAQARIEYYIKEKLNHGNETTTPE